MITKNCKKCATITNINNSIFTITISTIINNIISIINIINIIYFVLLSETELNSILFISMIAVFTLLFDIGKYLEIK